MKSKGQLPNLKSYKRVIDTEDWTEEDWKDLNDTISQLIERIRQRHARRRYVENGGSPYCNWSGE